MGEAMSVVECRLRCVAFFVNLSTVLTGKLEMEPRLFGLLALAEATRIVERLVRTPIDAAAG